MDKQHCPKLKQLYQKLQTYLEKMSSFYNDEFTRENIRKMSYEIKSNLTNFYIVVHEVNARVKHMQIQKIVSKNYGGIDTGEYIRFAKPGGHMFKLTIDDSYSELNAFAFTNQDKLGLKDSSFMEVRLKGDLFLKDRDIDPAMFFKNIVIEGDVYLNPDSYQKITEDKIMELERNGQVRGRIIIAK